MSWWHWAVMGLFLAALEILTPGGFYLLFFGLGGLAVAALTFLGIGGPLWMQVLLFTVFSVVSLLLFRNPLLRRLQSKTDSAAPSIELVGEIAIPVEAIEPGAVGRAELRGTPWAAAISHSRRLFELFWLPRTNTRSAPRDKPRTASWRFCVA